MSETLPQSWDTTELASVLDPFGATSYPAVDPVFGDGTLFEVGERASTSLSVFPDHHILRIDTPDLVLAMRRPTTMTVMDSGVLFDATSDTNFTSLSVGTDGTVTVMSTEIAQPYSELDREVDAHLAQMHQDAMRIRSEAEPRVELTGYAVADPRLSTTPNNVLVARFPLRTSDGDEVAYHNIVAFRERAELVAKHVQADHEYHVAGYVKEKIVPGSNRTISEVFLAGITRADDKVILPD